MPKTRQPHLWAIPLKREWRRYVDNDTRVPIIEAERPDFLVSIVAFRTSWPYTLATAREIVAAHNKQVRSFLNDNKTQAERARRSSDLCGND